MRTWSTRRAATCSRDPPIKWPCTYSSSTSKIECLLRLTNQLAKIYISHIASSRYQDRLLTGTDFVASYGSASEYPGLKPIPSGCMKDKVGTKVPLGMTGPSDPSYPLLS